MKKDIRSVVFDEKDLPSEVQKWIESHFPVGVTPPESVPAEEAEEEAEKEEEEEDEEEDEEEEEENEEAEKEE